MNTIKEIQSLNERELEKAVPPEGSWHVDYRDTAYIYIGGLSFDLSEGDIITIFSQYGEPVYLSLTRDKETGKSQGFAFLKYEDQRSTDLAVDNLCGTAVLGRVLKVDHTRYKRKEDEGTRDNTRDTTEAGDESQEDSSEDRASNKNVRGNKRGKDDSRGPTSKEELELQFLIRDHDEDDPMKDYLIRQKQEEIARAKSRARNEAPTCDNRERKRRHRHHQNHSRREDSEDSRGRYNGAHERDEWTQRRQKDRGEYEPRDRRRRTYSQ